MIGYQSCVYACACVMHVLIGNNFDISISTKTRRTEGFDILVFVLVLMSRLSSLTQRHLVLVSLVRTGLRALLTPNVFHLHVHAMTILYWARLFETTIKLTSV